MFLYDDVAPDLLISDKCNIDWEYYYYTLYTSSKDYTICFCTVEINEGVGSGLRFNVRSGKMRASSQERLIYKKREKNNSIMTCRMPRAFANRSRCEKSSRVSARVSTWSLLARGNLSHLHMSSNGCWMAFFTRVLPIHRPPTDCVGVLRLLMRFSLNNSYTCVKQLWRKLKSNAKLLKWIVQNSS